MPEKLKGGESGMLSPLDEKAPAGKPGSPNPPTPPDFTPPDPLGIVPPKGGKKK
ncbi:MAG: hypothetical protein ACRDHG_15465 [Anaerolineales bacterium]